MAAIVIGTGKHKWGVYTQPDRKPVVLGEVNNLIPVDKVMLIKRFTNNTRKCDVILEPGMRIKLSSRNVSLRVDGLYYRLAAYQNNKGEIIEWNDVFAVGVLNNGRPRFNTPVSLSEFHSVVRL